MPTDDLQSAGEKRKRKSDSSEDESTLKPYECRFCPMKFAKSQALGGHMNRHRQEREREQLLHARQLVLQQGLSWVSGQNSKQLNSRIAAGPPSLQSNFQLSSSLQWNVGGTKADDDSNNQGVIQQPGYTSHPQPYMVQHVPRSSFPGGTEMLSHHHHHLPPSGLDCNSVSYGGQADEEEQHQLDASSVNLQLGADASSSDFPPLQLGTGSSTDMPPMPLSSDTMGQLQIAVDCECPPAHQMLSLGGYQQNAFANDAYRNSTPSSYVDLMAAGSSQVAAPWDGLSWIFNNQKLHPLPSSTAESFSLALGQSQQHQEHQQADRTNCDAANGGKENGVALQVEDEPGHLSLLSYSEDRLAAAAAAAAAAEPGDLSLLNFSSSNDDDQKPANRDRDNNNSLDVMDDNNTRDLVDEAAEEPAAGVGGGDNKQEASEDENKPECVLGI